MTYLMYSSVAVLLIGVILLVLSIILGVSSSTQELNSPYECGFDPKGSGHLDFSVRYFLIAIVFLIFDVEIALLLPLVVTKFSNLLMIWVTISVVFVLALILGLFYEWSMGVLEWK